MKLIQGRIPMETVKDCHYPWTWMMITADGNVKPCCFSSGSLGNLEKKSVDEIWNGPTAQSLRKSIIANQVHSICKNAPCKFVQNTPLEEKTEITKLPNIEAEFDEEWYLALYSDVKHAVENGQFRSGWEHYSKFGKNEQRLARQCLDPAFNDCQLNDAEK